MLIVVVAVTLFVAIGRFSVPGHPLTGWAGGYEALAHISIGFLIGVAIVRANVRFAAIAAVAALSALEVVMFLVDASH